MRILASPADSTVDSNPYIHLLYRGLRRHPEISVDEWATAEVTKGRWDVVHLHWPELTVSPHSPRRPPEVARFLLALGWLRSRGARVVWTAHDLRPHDSGGKAWAERFYRIFSHQVDLLLVLSEQSGLELRELYPALERVPMHVTPHGHYRGVYPDFGEHRSVARIQLGLPERGRSLAFFGQIRPYKSVPRLVERFLQVAGPEHFLVVAGEVHDAGLRKAIERAAHGHRQIYLRLGHVPASDVHRYVRSADALVLPYRAILNSGTALLGLSFDRPVVVPAMGSLRELQRDVGSEWVRLYEGSLSEDVIHRVLTDDLPLGRPNLDRYDWERIADDTLDAYRSALKAPRSVLRARRRPGADDHRNPAMP